WARAWLTTAGLDTIGAAQTPDGLQVTRTRPMQRPAQRPHTLDVAGWTDGEQVLYAEAILGADEVTVATPSAGQAALLLPNAGDLTWARSTLSPQTLAALPTQLPQVGDPQHRAVVWVALADALATATVDPRLVV